VVDERRNVDEDGGGRSEAGVGRARGGGETQLGNGRIGDDEGGT